MEDGATSDPSTKIGHAAHQVFSRYLEPSFGGIQMPSGVVVVYHDSCLWYCVSHIVLRGPRMKLRRIFVCSVEAGA